MRMRLFAVWFFAALISGCAMATIEKETKPVVDPIKKTTQAVFKERKIGSEEKAQAVIFPRDQEETERKQFKLTF